jgi:hypothetical protein
MIKTIHGRIHGKTIELDEDLGVAEGQEVEVQVTIVQNNPHCAQDGGPGRPVFGRCRGMMTIVSEDDEHLKDFEEYMQ